MFARRHAFPSGLIAVTLALGGCAAFDRTTAGANQSLADLGERMGAPWGGQRPTPPPDAGRTYARISAGTPPEGPLEAEPGNVWPAVEAPRATLANPDAALRGIPDYRGPGGTTAPSGLIEPVQPGAARDATPREAGRPVQPRPARGSSSPPPPPELAPREAAERPPYRPPPPVTADRVDGRMIPTPGGPAITTGGTPRSQTYISPDGTPGVAQSSGGTTTLFGSDGTIRTVPNPR